MTIEKLVVVWGNQIGMPHKRTNSNNMDAYSVERSRGVVISGIADGSGGTGEHSETYAKIMIHWLTLRARVLVEGLGSQYNGVESIKNVSSILWDDYQRNLNKLLNIAFDGIPNEVVQEILTQEDNRNRKLKYVDEFMLHTAVLLIVILNEKTGRWDAYLLYKGDGFVVRNDEVMNFDNIIKPKHTGVMYPALGLNVYQGILRAENEATARAGFELVTLGSSGEKWSRLAIASDGLRFVMPDMYNEIIFPLVNFDLDQAEQDKSIGTAMYWAIKDRRFSPDDDLAIVSVMTQSYIDGVYRSIQEAMERQAEEQRLASMPKVSSEPNASISNITPRIAITGLNPNDDIPLGINVEYPDQAPTELDLPPVTTDDQASNEGTNNDG